MFSTFAKGYQKKENSNKKVWIYTRVSSKDQESNKSLKTQEENAERLARERKFLVAKRFGGTYESASGDFTRKEFSKLFQEVKSAKERPYSILINTISRFSRSGGGAIALAYELVDQLGVNLIEVSTGKSTETEDGKLEIYRGLIVAKQENIDRLRITIPGMKKFLEEGNWLGNTPRGFEHYGPRVKDGKYSKVQKITLNNEGLLLQKAWNWKLQGERDFVIKAKLENLGLKKVTKQFLSQMWRNPFYCGICVHKMLDGKVVKGNWENMVSEQDFLMVQQLVNGSKQGYKQDKASPYRPLTAFICCRECGGKLAGYVVKNKGIHYYKCQICKGISINANTTTHSKGLGAHDLFIEHLNSYTLKPKLQNLFKAQLKLTHESLNNDSKGESILLKKEIDKIKGNLHSLNTRYSTDLDFDKEFYLEQKGEMETKLAELNSQIVKFDSTISNLEKYIEASESVVKNISLYWENDSLETKKRVQDLVFKGSLSLDTQKRTYLTKKVNCVFDLSAKLSMCSESINEKRQPISQLPSFLVAGEGLEPTTPGL